MVADHYFGELGVHCDEVISENDNLYGNGVNIAARLEAQCSPWDKS